MIREATAEDLPRIVQLGARAHAGLGLPGAFCPGDYWAFCERLIADDDGVIFLSERGIIAGFKERAYYNTTFRTAREPIWWAEDGQGMALLDAYEKWAEDADQIRMGLVLSGRWTPALRMLGARRYEVAEMELVKHG